MAKFDISLDHGGIGEVLKSAQVAAAIKTVAGGVERALRAHSSVRGHGMPVDMKTGTTDRAKAFVTIAHPAGLAVQAKYGALTRAASSVGLEVKSK